MRLSEGAADGKENGGWLVSSPEKGAHEKGGYRREELTARERREGTGEVES